MSDVRTYTVLSSDAQGEGVHLILRGARILKPANGDPTQVEEIVLPEVCAIVVVPESAVVDLVKHIGLSIPGKVVDILKAVLHL